ncbi:MAG: transcriptional regulator NrdR [Dehalococcoidia bacterium]|nr:transcriptional regulator NrdR [Dehalococcoidia bacterium]
MKCPYCGFQDSKVVDSRGIDDGIRRRRQCLHCDSRFTTYERFRAESFMVIKKDGRREEFSREKLTSGIRKACAKRPISNEAIEGVVDKVEAALHHLGKVEVPSSTVGELVIEHLRELDRIAYIRFASVYREFTDIESFRKELDALSRSPAKAPATQLPLIPGDGLPPPAKKPRRAAG